MLSKMSLNVQERQRNSIIQMLSLNEKTTDDDGLLWKVLIYDQTCQDLIGPLMKVRTDLEELGKLIRDIAVGERINSGQ